MTLVALQNLVPPALARQSMSVRLAADQSQPLVLVPMLEQTLLSYIQQKWRQRPLTTKRRGALGQSVSASCVWCSTGNAGEVTRERIGWYITKGCPLYLPAAWEPLRVTIHEVDTHPVFVPWGTREIVPAKWPCWVWAARIWQLSARQNIRLIVEHGCVYDIFDSR